MGGMPMNSSTGLTEADAAAGPTQDVASRPSSQFQQQGATLPHSVNSAFTAVLPSNPASVSHSTIGPRGASIGGPAQAKPSHAPSQATSQGIGQFTFQSSSPNGMIPGATGQLPAGSRNRNLNANSRRPGSGASNASLKKHCNCKNSKCLKLYCECFASGKYCDNCNCISCCNNQENGEVRNNAIGVILDRNPNAFRPKIHGGAEEGAPAATNAARHNKGCNCKKSSCLKKYCECFQAAINCSENCKCNDCKNFEGSDAREVVLRTGPHAATAMKRGNGSSLATQAIAETRLAMEARATAAQPPATLSNTPSPAQPDKRRRITSNEASPATLASHVTGGTASVNVPVPAEYSQPHPQPHCAASVPSHPHVYPPVEQHIHPGVQKSASAMYLLQSALKEMLEKGGPEALVSMLLLVAQSEERPRENYYGDEEYSQGHQVQEETILQEQLKLLQQVLERSQKGGQMQAAQYSAMYPAQVQQHWNGQVAPPYPTGPEMPYNAVTTNEHAYSHLLQHPAPTLQSQHPALQLQQHMHSVSANMPLLSSHLGHPQVPQSNAGHANTGHQHQDYMRSAPHGMPYPSGGAPSQPMGHSALPPMPNAQHINYNNGAMPASLAGALANGSSSWMNHHRQPSGVLNQTAVRPFSHNPNMSGPPYHQIPPGPQQVPSYNVHSQQRPGMQAPT